MNGSLGAGVKCYTAVYLDKPIAFLAIACVRMKAKYYRASRLVVLPDYQGIGQTASQLYRRTLYCPNKNALLHTDEHPQIIRGAMPNWKITRYGHASRGRGDTRINNEIKNVRSRKRITVSLQYIPNCLFFEKRKGLLRLWGKER